MERKTHYGAFSASGGVRLLPPLQRVGQVVLDVLLLSQRLRRHGAELVVRQKCVALVIE
jgi:hypothetical protein